MARVPYTSVIKRVVPPWLQRVVGATLLESITTHADAAVEQLVDGVLLRLPGAQATIDPGALAYVGRERRIRRGPGEDAATYARRLWGWWDAHRTRGGPYALLGQLYAFFLDWLNVRMDVVYYSGTRRWIDEAGTITRDSIAWTASGPEPGDAVALAANALPGHTTIQPISIDGFPDPPPGRAYQVRLRDGAGGHELVTVDDVSGGLLHLTGAVVGTYSAGPATVERANVRWAHVWVFFYCPESIPGADRILITDDGDTLITDAGDTLVAESTITVGAITDAERAIFAAIPREWSAAHIPYVTVVLLYGIGELWEYPQPLGTWDDWEAAGGTFDSDLPQVFTAE